MVISQSKNKKLFIYFQEQRTFDDEMTKK